MNEENNIIKIIETLNAIPIPNWIKKNVMLALGKGIGNLIIASLDFPTAILESKSMKVRTRSKGNSHLQLEASKQAAKLFTSDPELADRALQYYGEDIIQKQTNREDIAKNFIDEISKQKFEDNNETEIDLDWLNSFWNIAETKSNEEIKSILAKILAREVSKPKSISPITLQLIPVLTSDIGKSFHKLCNISIMTDNFAFVIHPKLINVINLLSGELSDYGISLIEQLNLEGIGLIRSINVVSAKFSSTDDKFIDCDYAGKKSKMNFSNGINIIDFTLAGKEIRELLELTPNEEYTKFLMNLGKDKFLIE